MKHSYFLEVSRIAMVLLSVLPSAHAQQSRLALRFINSANGYSALPYNVSLYSRETGASMEFTGPQIGSVTDSPLQLESGVWDISVRAGGFQSLSSYIAVSPDASSAVEFFLDPVSPPLELRTQNIVALHRSDATVVVGFIVEDETGLPLANVSIRSTGTDVQVKTDERGFYKLHLPVTSGINSSRLEFRQSGFRSEVRENIEVWPNGDWIYNIRMKRGSGENSIDESKVNRQQIERDEGINCDNKSAGTRNYDNLLSSVVLPASIRVGRGCTGTSCTTVQIYSMQTYTKYVLPAEWYSCWGSLSNGMNSLQAGAVAIRSYGLWYVYHPLTSTYDICDNTFCQVVGSAQSTNANNAVDATDRYILTDFTFTNVMRAEYAAENNNKGCGDGFTGTGSTWPCISDMVCLGQTPNGHGRGVCQWGTIRWANGTRISLASPCAQGVSHGLGTKTWQEILEHYYPSYSLTQGATATLLTAALDPSTVGQGSTFTIRCTLNLTDNMELMIGAAIAPAGTTTYTYDSANDVKLSFFGGQYPASRLFAVPVNQPIGIYDLVVSLWFDTNNSNTIDAGDFLLNSQQYNGVLTITNTTNVEEQQPTAFALYQNYPNPFNPTTEIRFSVGTYGPASPAGRYTSLRVFDMLGREVAVLFNGEAEPAREYSVRLQGSSLASGVYTYRLISGGKTESKRLVVLR